jgi:hypothetical protein
VFLCYNIYVIKKGLKMAHIVKNGQTVELPIEKVKAIERMLNCIDEPTQAQKEYLLDVTDVYYDNRGNDSPALEKLRAKVAEIKAKSLKQ